MTGALSDRPALGNVLDQLWAYYEFWEDASESMAYFASNKLLANSGHDIISGILYGRHNLYERCVGVRTAAYFERAVWSDVCTARGPRRNCVTPRATATADRSAAWMWRDCCAAQIGKETCAHIVAVCQSRVGGGLTSSGWFGRSWCDECTRCERLQE